MLKIKHGFTLAEMMVVMLILSIIMAAMAPVMTTRNKLDQSSPWSWSTNGSDAYYGLGDAQVAMIGQEEVKPDDDAARLIINAGDGKNHILFKTGNSALGQLRFKNNGLLLGSLSSGDISSNSLGIGHNILLSTNSTSVGINNSASGNNSSSYGYNTKATAERSTAIGYNNTASNNISTAVGAENTASGSGALAIGNGNNSNSSYSLTVGASNIADKTESIAIGTYNEVNGEYSIAVGTGNVLNSNNSIGIGRMAAPSADAIAIGPQNTQAFGSHSIAIGNRASSMGEDAIAIGGVAENGIVTEALSYGAIAIGSSASAGVQNTVDNSLAIGVGTDSSEYSLALGGGSKAKNFAIAIGQSARAGMNYNSAYAIGIGYNADASSRSVALGVEANSAGTSSIAIGDLAVAAGDNNIAIGLNACRYVTGSNKLCIGANSGPQASSPYANDDEERIFIGSQSKFNGANAVLEVHNISETSNFTVKRTLGSYRIPNNASGVVINGDLIVKYAFVRDNAPKDYTTKEMGYMTLMPGDSVGLHRHEGNEDSYLIVSGTATYTDTDGSQYEVKEGDMTICRSGHSHAISNSGTTPLIFFAVLSGK